MGGYLRGLLDPPGQSARLREIERLEVVQRELARVEPSGELTAGALDALRQHFAARIGALKAGAPAGEPASAPAGVTAGPAGASWPAGGGADPTGAADVAPDAGGGAGAAADAGAGAGATGAGVGAGAASRPSLQEFLAERSILIVSQVGAFLLIVATVLFEVYGPDSLSGAARFAAVLALDAIFGAAGLAGLRVPRLRVVGTSYVAIFALMTPLVFVAAYVFLLLGERGISVALAVAVSGLACGLLYGLLAERLVSRGYAILSLLALGIGWGAAVETLGLSGWRGATLTPLALFYLLVGRRAPASSALGRLAAEPARALAHLTAATMAGWALLGLEGRPGLAPFFEAGDWPTTATLAGLTLVYLARCWAAGRWQSFWGPAALLTLTVVSASRSLGLGAAATALELVGLAWCWALLAGWMATAGGATTRRGLPLADGEGRVAESAAADSGATSGRRAEVESGGVEGTSTRPVIGAAAAGGDAVGGDGAPVGGAAGSEGPASGAAPRPAAVWDGPTGLRVVAGLASLGCALVVAEPPALQAAALLAAAAVWVPIARGSGQAGWLLCGAGLLSLAWYWLVTAVLPTPPERSATALALAYSPLPPLLGLAGLATGRLAGQPGLPSGGWARPLLAAAAANAAWICGLALLEGDFRLLGWLLVAYGLSAYAIGGLEAADLAVALGGLALLGGLVSLLRAADADPVAYPAGLAVAGWAFYLVGRLQSRRGWVDAHLAVAAVAAGGAATWPLFEPRLRQPGQVGPLVAAGALWSLAGLVAVERGRTASWALGRAAGLLAALGCGWVARYLGAVNAQWYVVAPGLWLVWAGETLRREAGVAQAGVRGRVLAALGAALLLGTTAWQAVGGGAEAWAYTAALVLEALLAVLVGIGLRSRVLVLAGAVGVAAGGLRALFLFVQQVPLWVVFGSVALVLLVAAAGLAFARDRIGPVRGTAGGWSDWG
jgi:hypothetical protein